MNLSISSRWVFVAAIAVAHVAFARLIDIQFAVPAQLPLPSAGMVTAARFIVQATNWDTSPFPEVDLEAIALHPDALQVVRFDEGDEDWLAGIVGTTSAPHPHRIQSVDIREYAQRAGLRAGQLATVVLSIEIQPDGTVRSPSVIRSCGNRRVDVLAMDYARQLIWFPGTVDRQPQTVRIVYPVTLVAPGGTARRS